MPAATTTHLEEHLHFWAGYHVRSRQVDHLHLPFPRTFVYMEIWSVDLLAFFCPPPPPSSKSLHGLRSQHKKDLVPLIRLRISQEQKVAVFNNVIASEFIISAHKISSLSDQAKKIGRSHAALQLDCGNGLRLQIRE